MRQLTHERLLSVLRYSPRTGLFTWVAKTGKKVRPGSIAGCASGCYGYIRINVDGESYQAHRLAFFYVTGKWPVRFIDHRNGIRSDNRWGNLREASDAINLENQRRAKSNSIVGLLGVSRNQQNTFFARIRVAGVMHHLGTFKEPGAAHAAYVKAKRQLHKGCTI